MTEQQTTLTPLQAAKYIGVSDAALRLWRSRGEGPRHFRAGEKLVRYRRTDLDSWIESRLSEPTPAEVAYNIGPLGRLHVPAARNQLRRGERQASNIVA